jgi:methionyl-tRNA formyltransferase
VNGEPEFVGATFMYMDSGIDTGEVSHQIRAEIREDDTPHQIGNRLIAEIGMVYRKFIKSFHNLEPVPQLPIPENAKFYLRKDFSPESVRILYENFKSGMIRTFLENKDEKLNQAPIIQNPTLVGVDI